MNTLYGLENLDAHVDISQAIPMLNHLFPDTLNYIEVMDLEVVDTPTSDSELDSNELLSTYSIILALKHSLVFPIPLLNSISLGIVADNPDKWPLIQMEIELGQSASLISLKYFPLRVTINNPYLKTVLVNTESEAAEEEDEEENQSENIIFTDFTFEIEGSIKIGSDLTLQTQLESFSIPIFTIVQSGMLFSLTQCKIITHPDDISDEIIALGFDEDFRGIYARNAHFSWNIPFTLLGAALPGIALNLENLALGNQGLSVEATFNWDVVTANGQIDVTQSEMAGNLFLESWQCALQQLRVNVERNEVTETGAVGVLKLGFIEQIIKVELGYQYESAELIKFAVSLSQQDSAPLRIDLGASATQLSLNNMSLAGEFNSAGEFTVSGKADIELLLPGLQLSAENLSIELQHNAQQDSLVINLTSLQLEGFGEISDSQLTIVFIKNEQSHELALLEISSQMAWLAVSERFQLNSSIPLLPQPLDNATVQLMLAWQQQELHFSIKAELDSIDSFFDFLPHNAKPRIKDTVIEIELVLQNNEFIGELGVGCALMLPELNSHPLTESFTIISGDEEGWFTVRIAANLSTGADNAAAGLRVQIKELIMIEMQIPGLSLPEAPITIELEELFLDLTINEQEAPDTDAQAPSEQEFTGELRLIGSFQLHPILPDFVQTAPAQIVDMLDRLLSVAKRSDLNGTAALTLGFNNDQLWMESELAFTQANIELDLFDMLTHGLSGLSSTFAEQSSSEIDIDIEVAISLQSMFLRLGSADSDTNSPFSFAFGFNALLNFASVVDFPLVFELSDQKFSFGISELIIPIMVPKLPFSNFDLLELEDSSGRWDIENNWVKRLEPDLDEIIDNLSNEFDDAKNLLSTLKTSGQGETEAIFELQYRTIPQLQKQLFNKVGKRFIYQAILTVHHNLLETSQSQYEQYIKLYQRYVDTTLGWIGFDTQLTFNIKNAKFVLPFNDPSDVRVEGSASFGGVVPNSILAPLADVELTLGISADAIYFAVEGGLEPIPLPDFGRYPGSAIKLDKLALGYGYSKSSLKIDFAGELTLSEQLIADADTSDDANGIGAGIRLPSNSAVKFNLDLIPITLGEVDFLLPLLDFNIDLSSKPPPPPPPMDGSCRPSWDGLQLIVPEILRADIKKMKYSPFFGPILAANGALAVDLEVGNNELGISYITDYSYIGPIAGMLYIPLLTDTSPFFERLCTRIQIAGFGLSFDLTRPMPKPSPMLVFELLGFISEPTLDINPNGDIANLMYAQLYHGRISAPPAIEQMFPGFDVFNQDFSGKINVASVIAMGQHIQTCLADVQDMLLSSANEANLKIDRLLSTPLTDNIQQVLSLLPMSMRVVERDGRWLGFDASSLFYLALPQDLLTHYNQGTESENDTLQTGFELIYENKFESSNLSDFKVVDYGLKRGKGDWKVRAGKLVQHNNVGDNSPARYGAMLIHQSIDVASARISVDAMSIDNDGMGLIFHFQSKDSFYRFRMTEEQQRWHLDKVFQGKVTTLFEQKSAFISGKQYALVVQVTPHENADIRIRIWVDNDSWCDLIDPSSQLRHGTVGFDSWWNKGVTFDNIRVQRVTPLSLSLSDNLSAEQLHLLNSTLTKEQGAVHAMPSIFGRFTLDDALAALPTHEQTSVIVASEVKITQKHRLYMLGYVKSNGEFSLLTGLNISPFSISINGLTLPILIEVSGRASLHGKSAGADSIVSFEAQFFADWTILEGSVDFGPVARLLLGSREDPIHLSMSSDRKFSILGQGELQLFGNALRVRGEVDASQAHCLLIGDVEFTPDIMIVEKRLISLVANVRGRIGPSNFVELVGKGQIYLFEKAFITAQLAITQNQIALSMYLGVSRNREPDEWSVGGFVLSKPRVELEGSITFADQFPKVKLRGELGFSFFGASVQGRGQFETFRSSWLLFANGDLTWLDRQWLSGSIRVSSSGVTIQGQVDFTLPLSKQDLGAGMQIAGLVISVSLKGKFKLNELGQLVYWDFDANWKLAVQLPGTDNEQQSLPIASQSISIGDSHSGTNSLFELAELFTFDQLTIFDFSNVAISVPHIDIDNTTDFYPSTEEKSISGLSFNIPVATIFSHNSDGDENETLIPLVLFSENTPISLSDTAVSVPVIRSEQNSNRSNILFSLPTFSTEEVNLGNFSLEDQFELKLAWEQNKLGVIVKIGSQTTFFAFP